MGTVISGHWSIEEIDYLKDNFRINTIKDTSTYLNRSRSAVQSKLRKMGLIKDEKSRIRYKYNSDVFEIINTEEKAYWLGFIGADGCVHNKKDGGSRLKISLKLEDKPHLEKFNEFINGNVDIKKIINKIKDKAYNACEIVINSTKMCKDLINLGVIPNKTFNLALPKIKEEFYFAYIRGFVDGDGCLYCAVDKNGRLRHSMEIVGASLIILEEIKEYFKLHNITSQIYIKRKGNYKLMIYDKKSILTFLKLFYLNSNIYLNRKYDKAVEMNNRLAV